MAERFTPVVWVNLFVNERTAVIEDLFTDWAYVTSVESFVVQASLSAKETLDDAEDSVISGQLAMVIHEIATINVPIIERRINPGLFIVPASRIDYARRIDSIYQPITV